MVVDQDKDSLVRARALGCRVENGNGVDFLAEQLKPGIGPDWIVPAVPVHLAGSALQERSDYRTAVPGRHQTFYPIPCQAHQGISMSAMQISCVRPIAMSLMSAALTRASRESRPCTA